MTKIWKENIDAFLREASSEEVKMLLVGVGQSIFTGTNGTPQMWIFG